MWLSVEPVHAPPCPGDIILIACRQQYIAHRVVVSPDPSLTPLLLTKGDGCPFPDPPIYRDQVVGKVSVPDQMGTGMAARQFLIRQMQGELYAGTSPGGYGNGLHANPNERSCYFEMLFPISLREGLEAFLCNRLEQLGLSAVLPEAIALRAEQRFFLHRVITSRLLNEYRQVAGELSRAGVSFVPVKGIALAQTVYAHLKDRSFNDLDILVKTDQILTAVNILKNRGYRQDPLRTRLGARAALALNHHLPPFRKDGIVIELHYRLLPAEPDGFSEAFLNHSVPDQQSGWLPDPIYHAVFLAAHLEKHASRGEFQYRLIRDLALILGSNPESWTVARQLATKYAIEDSFVKAQRCFDILYREGRHPETGEIFQARCRGRLDFVFGNLADLKGPKLKLMWWYDCLFPSAEYIRKFHPGCSGIRLPCYYLRRLLKGFKHLLFR